MLARVQKLEAARITPRSPIEVAYGSMDAFAEQANRDVGAGKLDKEFLLVVECLRRWHADQVWAAWQHHRNGMWDCR
jgi:hypothetical protein